ncbi:hypothetical protein [Yersinia pseudotuberculosis]|uniref:hypothetical protein n=1 Tax=Yersinia pseudotuberculosis TaxID=633 RepID=UPI001A9E709E|nr:hypothetical protein [Yersinia pseudotuberculosis]MBO1560696.1 hypothetical protein [Yersinia pseudotuberculosis]
MAKKFYEKEIKAIVKIIENWNKPDFTWDCLCKASYKTLGKIPTRQALSQHTEIVVAYKTRKRAGLVKHQNTKLPGSLTLAARRIERLENDNAALKQENNNLLLMIQRMHENAYRHNILASILEEELPQRARK